MLWLIRIALQVMLFFFLLSVVVAIGHPDTGSAEKLAAVAFGGLLIWLAVMVRRIGAA